MRATQPEWASSPALCLHPLASPLPHLLPPSEGCLPAGVPEPLCRLLVPQGEVDPKNGGVTVHRGGASWIPHGQGRPATVLDKS